MADRSKIEWTDSSWTPIRAVRRSDGRKGWHCEHVSPGCKHCYAESMNLRLGTGLPFKPGHVLDVEIRLEPHLLDQPIRWAKPRMIFVCSMTDLFGEFVPTDVIDYVFAVMALCPWHTFQVVTKRSARMRAYCNDPGTPHRVAKAMDALTSAAAPVAEERVAAIDGFPGYFVTDRGRVLSDRGSAQCVHCGQPVERTARARYCSKRCRQNGQYRLRTGKPMLFPASLAEMSPDVGEDGHRRVMLYRDGQTVRELVHRLVLTAFERPAADGEQGRHRDGDPSNNSLANLSWGDQPANWDDRRRHGAFRSYAKLTHEQAAEIRRRFDAGETGAALGREFGISDTQARNIGEGRQWAVAAPIAWPLANCWKGVSVEDQRRLDERAPDLVASPAAVRFISAEPLLGPLSLRWGAWFDYHAASAAKKHVTDYDAARLLDWVIAGGESGRDARPMHPDWARGLRDQCAAAGVPFFFKQWGEWAPIDLDRSPAAGERVRRDWMILAADGGLDIPDHRVPDDESGECAVVRVGKKAAGRLLNGVEHNGMPDRAPSLAGAA